MPKKLLNDLDRVEDAHNDIEMMPLLGNTESLLSETSFNSEAFTEQERRGLNLELQTLRGNLKHLKSKMIFYDGEIAKTEAKVKRLEMKKAEPGVSEEQRGIWDKDLAKAKEDL